MGQGRMIAEYPTSRELVKRESRAVTGDARWTRSGKGGRSGKGVGSNQRSSGG